MTTMNNRQRMRGYQAHNDLLDQVADSEIGRQRDVISHLNRQVDHLGIRLGEIIKERDALRSWAERGKWLLERLTERYTPDGRCVLEIADEPIWTKPDGTLQDYIAAVDLAMERDESRGAV